MFLALKKRILSKILESLHAEMQVMTSAALVAREAATHEESIAEDKYDTRGLEASYLAGAQAKRAAELKKNIHELENLELKEFNQKSHIALTALVEIHINNQPNFFLLAPRGGGIQVEVDNIKSKVLTPDSLLGSEVLGKKVGDFFELKIANKTNEYEIKNIF